MPCVQEGRTDRAQEVYGLYLGLAKRAAGDAPLRLCVEIHGNSEPRSAREPANHKGSAALVAGIVSALLDSK